MSARTAQQIGYGPPGAVEHRASVARGLVGFGLGIPFGVVLGLPDTLAIDTGRSLGDWFLLLAGALGLGLVVAALLGRAAANLSASIGSMLAALAAVASISWLVLFNVGDTTAVSVLVVIGLGASVPSLVLSGIDALGHRPDARPLDAIAGPAAAAFAGVMVGSFVMFLDPTLVWSDLTAAGGVVAAVGALRRLVLPHAVRGAGMRRPPLPQDRSPLGVRMLLAGSLGVVAGGVVRVAPYLAEDWQAGVRYHLLALAIAGGSGLALLVAMVWLPPRWQRSGATEVDDVARLALLVAGIMLLVAISETLPGTVVGTGVAAGVALAAVSLLAAAGARGEGRPAAAIAGAGVVGLATWVLTWLVWPTLVDAAGSERVVMALAAVPALAAGAMVTVRPVGSDVAATAPLDTAPAGTAIDLARPPTNGNGATPHPAPLLLEARDVEFSYGSVQVLFGVDLQVRAGEVVALLGTNGAGKTTFLRTVAGLAAPSAGSVRMAGGDLAPFSASERVQLGINQIATGAVVAPDLSVGENLAMFGHTLRPADARAGRSRALEVFPRLGERLGQPASSLSGGERQMLSLAKSLVLRPRLLIVDELTLGLAPIAVASLVPVIERLHDEGSAVLLVEQSVHLALDLADRAYCMEKGRIVYQSDAAALRDDAGLLEAVYLEGITAALEHRAGASGSAAT